MMNNPVLSIKLKLVTGYILLVTLFVVVLSLIYWRIIAVTNENIEKAIAEGRFREDLYHRLNEFTIEVPPLRECWDDILPLAAFKAIVLSPKHNLPYFKVKLYDLSSITCLHSAFFL